MKKLLTLAAVFAAWSAVAQTYVPLKDFQDQSLSSGGWSAQVVTSNPGTYTWTVSNVGTGSNYYGRASGWNGSSGDNTELWLISPSFNLTSATIPALNFDNAKNFSGPALAVKVSSNYTGTGNPNSATWTDVTSSATWSTGSFTFVNSGNVSLAAFNGSSSVYVAFVYTSTTAAGAATWEVDDIVIQEGGVAPPPVLKIRAIQYATSAPFASAYDGQAVTTSGVVTAKHADGIWLQDTAQAGWNGIYVYSPGLSSFSTAPNVGDSLTLTGTVDEFNELTQLTFISASTNHGGGYTRTPKALSTTAANAEMWESGLVSVSSAVCTQTGLTGNQWEVNDGSGVLLVDDLMYAAIAVLGNNYDLTGIMYYSFSEWKIEPRSVADVVDNSGGAPQVSTYDIQFNTTSPFDSPYANQTVETGGIVFAIQKSTTTTDTIAFWIQAGDGPYSGVYVYDVTMPSVAPEIGDSVTLIGTVVEFNGLTQVTNLALLNIVSSGNPVPSPEILSTFAGNDEQWESVFVRFENASVIATGLPVNQFEINDGSGANIVDDLLYLHAATVGHIYNVQGPLYYSFSEWKVEPRDANDIENISSVNELTASVLVYPNPAEDVIMLNGAEGSIVELIAVNGQKVFEGSVNAKVEALQLTGISPGIYMIRITMSGQVAVKQIVVE
jgi:predicted extracellular nuclease